MLFVILIIPKSPFLDTDFRFDEAFNPCVQGEGLLEGSWVDDQLGGEDIDPHHGAGGQQVIPAGKLVNEIDNNP